jgi:hypothetical protein
MEQILCWYLERKLLCSRCCPGSVVRGTFDSVLPAKTSFRSAIQPSLSGTRLRRHTRHCSSRCWMRSFGYVCPMGDVRQFETPADANKHFHLIQRSRFYRTLHSSCRHKYVLLLSQYHLAYHDISLVYQARRLEDGSRTLPSPRPRHYVRWRSSIDIRNWQWQQTVAVTIMVIFGSLLALGTPNNMGMMIAFLTLSLMGYGWSIYLCIAITQMGVEQEQLGTSGGLSGCVRFAGGSIAQAVYLAIFTTQVTKWTVDLVPTAAEVAGLPADQVTALLGLVGTAQFSTTYSPAIVSAVGAAVQEAYRKGIQ